MPITRGDWWSQSQRPILKQGRAVTADGDVVISREKATASLRANSITLYFAGATSTEALGQVRPCSTANAVWRPPVNVNVLRVMRYSLALEEMATCDNFVLYGNAGTCIGGILLSAGTTNPAAYTRTASGALTVTALAACPHI